MSIYLTDIFLKPFQSKRLFFSGLIAWFIFSALFWSIVHINEWFDDREQLALVNELNALPATAWVEYSRIEPVQPSYGFDELITMRSFITRRRSATVTWNDVLFCDKMGTGEYTNIDAEVDTTFIATPKVRTYESTWVFGKPGLTRPYAPSVDCYIESRQTVCPALITTDDRIQCKPQVVKSEHFTLTNP